MTPPGARDGVVPQSVLSVLLAGAVAATSVSVSLPVLRSSMGHVMLTSAVHHKQQANTQTQMHRLRGVIR